jgi:hypothetical protein
MERITDTTLLDSLCAGDHNYDDYKEIDCQDGGLVFERSSDSKLFILVFGDDEAVEAEAYMPTIIKYRAKAQ